MPWVDDGLRRHRRQPAEAVVHVFRVASGKVGPPAALEEQGVPADQTAVDMEALAARRVTGSVHERDRDVTHHDDVTRVVLCEVRLVEAGRAHHPGGLCPLHVNRAVATVEQRSDTLDGVPHHRPTDVVGVVVGGKDSGAPHAIGLDQVEDVGDRVGGVDEHALTGRTVSDGIDEVDHLLGDRIAHGEVPTGEQLTEVQTITFHPAQATPVR